MQPGPCYVPLTQDQGTGFNTFASPDTQGAQYKSITEQLLYEIMQGILLLVAATVTNVAPITFTIGDGQAGTPAAGTSTLETPAIQGQTIFNKSLIVARNGILLQYTTPATAAQIKRYNNAGNGGFYFDPASGLTFQAGETYSIFVFGVNTANAV
jgi:hypothetical protein